MVVVAFMFICAMMVMFAGIATMLKTQMADSLTIKSVSLARIQAFYVAEMGVNDIMFWANKTPTNPTWPSTGTVVDFTPHVSMVRNATTGYAEAAYVKTSSSPVSYQVIGRVVVDGDATVYTRAVSFSTTYNGSMWVLSSYAIIQ